MSWLITDKGDKAARALAKRHYICQSKDSVLFTRPGENIVLSDIFGRMVWVTTRPKPGIDRDDGRKVWECSIFRNETKILSSSLILEVVQLTWAIWGQPPSGGIITFVDPPKIKSPNPGYCFKMAGWIKDTPPKSGKPCLRAPNPDTIPPFWEWHFKPGRGGKLKRILKQRAWQDFGIRDWAA